jgi:hypothetical protein
VQQKFAISIANRQTIILDIDDQEVRRSAAQMAAIADTKRRKIRRRGRNPVEIAGSKAPRLHHSGHPSAPIGVFGLPPRSIRHLS